MKSLSSILERCVEAGAERRAYTFLAQGRDEARMLTYGELHRLAGKCARRLRERVARGDRVLLTFDNSLDFIVGFMACVFARAIAVPVPPPDVSRLKRTLPRIQSVVADCEAAAIVTSLGIRDQLAGAFAGASDLHDLPWIVTDDLEDVPHMAPELGAPGDLALLQYTSGSTSAPKGVMVSHANLLDNLARLQHSFRYTSESTTVTWMPYFHDYGLIDGLLEPLFAMASCYVISPVAFVKRPWTWLEAVSRYRATHIHGPTFAFQLCVDRAADHAFDDLDLSSLIVAGCAAEPVRRDTAERFIASFSRFGFRPEAFAPAYGLAEATLVVSAKPTGTLHRTAFLSPDDLERGRCVDVPPDQPRVRAVLSCGVASGGFPLAIVDPDSSRVLPDDEVGEIWLAGPSVAGGYWQQAADTEATFGAFTAAGDGPMLRTGDLGFTRQGEIYVTGRLKDVVIINGNNHYPHDIEQTVEAAEPAVRPTCVAAFAVDHEGGEGLVIVAEISRRHVDADAVFTAIRSAVSLQHEISCEAIVLLPKGSILKTSSGKIQRRACRDAYLNGGFAPVAEWRQPARIPAPPPAIRGDAIVGYGDWQTWLQRLVASRTQVEDRLIDPSAPFSSFGLSSIDAVEIAAYIEDQTQRAVPITALWEYPSIRAFAIFLAGGGASPERHARPADAGARPQDGARGSQQDDDAIAVIGMACEFPGDSHSPGAFWRTLTSGGDAITPPPAGRFPRSRSSGAAGYVRDVFRFDAGFFGISDREAQSLDPQQRLLLETAWHALEDAGILPASLAGSDAGVFVGVSATDYAQQVYGAAGGVDRFAATGTSAAVISNRLSYFLDARGPSLTIDTACSASLVAVHQACQALLAGDCGVALAGGVNAILSADATAALERAQMLSPTNCCRPFDAAADGYVRGEGCGVVLLKTLSAARRDGNRILAIIRGSAVVQDGRSNGLSAPNGAAQRDAIRRALARARTSPDAIEYVEAHGTGTPLGDPIELHALVDCYGRSGVLPCRVGAVKGAIGHLEGAAGIAGLIKTILILRHETIPANTHLQTPTAHADLGGTRLTLPVASTPWPAGERERVAAVSSFGFGGTLAHVILSDDGVRSLLPFPRTEPYAEMAKDSRPHLLVISARERIALRALALRYAQLSAIASTDLANMCASAALTRTAFADRAAFVFTSREDLTRQLSAFAEIGETDLLTRPIDAPETDRPLTPRSETETMLASLGRLYVDGLPVGWDDLFPALTPALASELPLYPFGGREYRIDGSERSSILEALAAGRTDEAIKQLRAQRPGLGDRADLVHFVHAVSALHRQQVEGLAEDRPQTYRTEWEVVDLQPASPATQAERPCFLIGDDDARSARIGAAIDRCGWLRRVSSLPPKRADAIAPLILFHGTARSGEAPDEAALRLAIDLVSVLRELGASKQKAKVWVITEGAMPVVGGEAVRLDGACLWGVGKAAALELPDLWGGLVDLPSGFDDADADRLMRGMTEEGGLSSDEDQWALRGGHWFASRLAAAPLPDATTATSFRHDAVYWIAGGTGALGRHVLQTLLDGGARHVVLTGRREFTPDGSAAETADVQFVRADICSVEDCARVLAHIDAAGRPLAGIVHAAGIANERLVDALTAEQFRDVAAAKVTGAWNLHTLTHDRRLDFFVCFSSIAALWGSAAQAHYAAGNHFLDMLCEHRRALGQPALAIGWGPWRGGGMATPAVQARLVKAGLDLLEPAAAIDLFKTLLGTDYARVAGVDVRWDAFGATFTARRPSPFLSRFMTTSEKATERRRAAIPDLDVCTPDQLRVRVRDHLRAVVAEALGVDRVPEMDRGFFDLGLDSLAVVAIRRRLTADFGASVSSADMFNYPTINALAAHVVQLLRPDLDARAADPVESDVDAMSQRELMERIGLEFDALGNVAE